MSIDGGKSSKKHRRVKRKKKSKKLKSHTESDEDITPLHAVNIIEGEMPEGARTSGEDDDRNVDDPHRALNIDLEEPVNHVSIPSVPVVNSLGSWEESKIKKHRSKKESRKERSKKNHETDGHKSKRVKKERKRKERDRERSRNLEEPPKDKAEYEEAPGIATPSKEPGFSLAQTPMTPSMSLVSSYKLLSEDKNIRMTFEVRILPNSSNQVLVSLIFQNQCNLLLKDLELSIIETSNISIFKENGDNEDYSFVKVPFQLLPSTNNEIQIVLSVKDITLFQTLRGTLTYIVVEESTSTHDKLDFKRNLPASSYMIGAMNKRDTFTDLLSSNDLSATDSIMVAIADLDFLHILAKICFHCHFSVVEQLGTSASLYSRSIQDDHVCLLVKLMNQNNIGIEAKGSNPALIISLLEEIKSLFYPVEDEIL